VADSRLCGDVVKAGRGEPGAGERAGGGVENLLTSFGSAHPPARFHSGHHLHSLV
jgi:hypothetical protein